MRKRAVGLVDAGKMVFCNQNKIPDDEEGKSADKRLYILRHGEIRPYGKVDHVYHYHLPRLHPGEEHALRVRIRRKAQEKVHDIQKCPERRDQLGKSALERGGDEKRKRQEVDEADLHAARGPSIFLVGKKVYGSRLIQPKSGNHGEDRVLDPTPVEGESHAKRQHRKKSKEKDCVFHYVSLYCCGPFQKY